mgnify:CR=1 FL=1
MRVRLPDEFLNSPQKMKAVMIHGTGLDLVPIQAAIGTRVAKICRSGFGMRVLAGERPNNFVNPEVWNSFRGRCHDQRPENR